MRVKPIIFNTEMVRAILDGRKTVTRRVVKQAHLRVLDSPYHKEHPEVPDIVLIEKLCVPPYQPEDILYVRETFAPLYPDRESKEVCGYMYKADTLKDYDRRYPDGENFLWEGKWHPSIYMPKDAARIWLRVTDVRVERLQDITEDDATRDFDLHPEAIKAVGMETLCKVAWNSTIKKSDLDKYGWEANPWVWVIAFERCEKAEKRETGKTAAETAAQDILQPAT